MHWYTAAFIVGYIIAAILAWNVPRAQLWAGMLVASFAMSSWWHDASLPYGAAFGAGTNFAICFALYAVAVRRYEMRLWNVLHLMIAVDMLYLWGAIKSHFVFAISLEVANGLAILVIGATGIMEIAGYGIHSRRHRVAWVDRLRLALFGKRTLPPFWSED